MHTQAKLPLKQLYIILIACSLIIFLSSIDVLMRVKDISLFENWVKDQVLLGDPSTHLNQYVGLNLSLFFMKIIVPVSFAIYSYAAYVKIKINQLYVLIWTILNIGGLAYTAFDRQHTNILYYVIIFCYILLVLTLLTLIDVIRESKSK
jgi:hypothetical protein